MAARLWISFNFRPKLIRCKLSVCSVVSHRKLSLTFVVMNEFLECIYLRQAKEECESCFNSINAFNAALASDEADDPFVRAMEFIHYVAKVSRIFWPPGSRDKHARQRAHRRGEALRRSLSIQTGHPIQVRTLRDHFEHFDERLDHWAEHSKNRNIIGKLLGPRSAVGGDAIQDSDIIHHFDPATKIYAFRGEKFDIQSLASGLDDIYTRVNERLMHLDHKRTQR